jgi:very-short-patch-repair endonuclease
MNNADELIFFASLKIYNIDIPIKEYLFAKELKRKFRFDYCYPDVMLAIEIEGGIWINGRHNRASGFIKDIEKYNTACMLGYRVLRFTIQDLKKIATYETIVATIHNIKALK